MNRHYRIVHLLLLLPMLFSACGVFARIVHQQEAAEEVEGPPPQFRQPDMLLTTLTVARGSTVKINCTAAVAQPIPNITWTRDGATIEQRIGELSYDKWSLLMWNVQAADAGNYECRLCNRFGCIAHSTKLIISEFDDGDDDLEEMKESNEQVIATTMKTITTTTMTIATTIASNKFTETETISKDNVNVQETNIQSAPRFRNNDTSPRRVPAGSTIALNCQAYGVPMPTQTWTKNNITNFTRSLGDVRYKKWGIELQDAIVDDSGLYQCKVCNVAGCIEREMDVVVVNRMRSPPIMSDKYPQNMTVLTNGTAELECNFKSDLEPFIRWIKFHNLSISVQDTEKYVPILRSNNSGYDSKHYVMLNDANTRAIHLINVTHADEGWYACIAASSLGQAWARAYVRVVDTLPEEMPTLIRSHPIWYTLVPVVVIVFVLGIGFFVYVLRRLKQERLLKHRIEMVHQWTKKVIIYQPSGNDGGSCEFQMPVVKIEKQRTTTFQTNGNGNMTDATQLFSEYEFPLDENWEIPRTQLTLGSTLGEGAFGRVVRAEACSLQTSAGQSTSLVNTNTTVVAVKMVKEEHTDADMASLVREMEVMKMIGKHFNIINLLGCCSQNGPLWVIVEFAPHGNLKDFLKRNRPMCAGGPTLLSDSSYMVEERPCSDTEQLTTPPPLVELTEKKLISFAFQIARGMEYLASRRCIHRDLAARNVLVSDDYVLKIADFGLARDIQDTDYYRKNTNGRLPIKWMAPESLQEKFYDSQSDVWSYGVLLWEIMTYGEQPYPNIICAEELYSYLITGQRMEKPQSCSLNIYMLMRQCWHFDGWTRPTFTELVENLGKIIQFANSKTCEDYLDLSMPMLETPPSSDDENDCEDNDTSSLDGNMDVDVVDAGAGITDADRHLPSQLYQYTYKFNK